MAEALSSFASAITLLGCTAESVKVLSSFFRQFNEVPTEVRQWLELLESLHSTLNGLQQCGTNLEPRHRFSADFTRKLGDCLSHLQDCVTKIRKIQVRLAEDNSGSAHKWNQAGRKSWEKVKWTVRGKHKRRKMVEVVSIYHFEFSMELFNLMLNIIGRDTPTTIPPANPEPDTSLHQQPSRNESPEPSATPICELLSEPISPQGARALQEPTRSTSTSPTMLSQENIGPHRAHSASSFWSQPFIRSVVWLSWSLSTCKFVVRAGPIPVLGFEKHKSHLLQRQKRIGFGINFSICQSRYWKKKLDLSCYLLHVTKGRSGMSLHWNLDFPRLVSESAEVFECVRRGLTKEVEWLFTNGKATARDINVFGITALHIAAKVGHLELVQLLLHEGADVNAQDEDGESPLHAALTTDNNYTVARVLIENGADLANRAADGKTPLHSLFNNTVSEILTKDHWIEPVSPDSEGLSITHFLAWSSRTQLEVFQHGRKYDETDLWAVDSLGRTCLHLAASRGNLDVLTCLLQRASLSEVNRRDFQGLPPLHYATQSSRAVEVIDILIASNCSIDAVDNLGQTALHWAARWENLEAAKKLRALDLGGCLSREYLKDQLPSDLVREKKQKLIDGYLGSPEPLRGTPEWSLTNRKRFPKCAVRSHPDVGAYGLYIRCWIFLALASVLWQVMPSIARPGKNVP